MASRSRNCIDIRPARIHRYSSFRSTPWLKGQSKTPRRRKPPAPSTADVDEDRRCGRGTRRRARPETDLIVVLFVFRLVLSRGDKGYATVLAEHQWSSASPATARSSICKARAKVHEDLFLDLHREILRHDRADRRWHLRCRRNQGPAPPAGRGRLPAPQCGGPLPAGPSCPTGWTRGRRSPSACRPTPTSGPPRSSTPWGQATSWSSTGDTSRSCSFTPWSGAARTRCSGYGSSAFDDFIDGDLDDRRNPADRDPVDLRLVR